MARTVLKYDNNILGIKDLPILLDDQGFFSAKLAGTSFSAQTYDNLKMQIEAEASARIAVVWTPLIHVQIKAEASPVSPSFIFPSRFWRGRTAAVTIDAPWDVPEDRRLAESRIVPRTMLDVRLESGPMVDIGRNTHVYMAYDELVWDVLAQWRNSVDGLQARRDDEVKKAIQVVRTILPESKRGLF